MMTCSKFQSRIEDYLDGLPEASRAEMDAHLRRATRSVLADMQVTAGE